MTLRGEWTFPDAWNRKWQGGASAEMPICGIIFFSHADKIYWAKSSTFANTLEMSCTLHPLRGSAFQVISSLGWSVIDAASVDSLDGLPEIVPFAALQTGQLFTLVRFQSSPPAELSVLLLVKDDVKVARNHIWGLKKRFHADLTSLLLNVFSHGRRGEFPL
ncbi:MAG: hypothetical protein ABI835_09810 [Chloroflexota bacterium]